MVDVREACIQDIIWYSAREAFTTMVPLRVERVDPPVEPSSSAQSLICTITFTGTLQGFFSVLCSCEGVEKMTRAMLMMEPDDQLDETEVCDAYGEITNILVGGFKSRVAEHFPEMKISIPSVVRGQKITPGAGSRTERVDLDVHVDGSPMKLAVAYRAKKQ